MESNQDSYGLATRAIHIGQNPDQWSSMSVVPPITLSTTFKQDSPAEPKVVFFSIFLQKFQSVRIM